MEQKKKESYSKSINGVSLYRNDIDYLIKTLNSNSVAFEIEDDSHIYSDLDEFITINGTKPKTFNIEGKSENPRGWVKIKFTQKEMNIHTFGSPEMYRFGIELKDYFSPKAPWLYRILNPWAWWFIAWVCFMLSNLTNDDRTKDLLPWLKTPAYIIIVVWIFTILYRNLRTGLTLEREHEYGFWVKNKEKVILAIFSLILGSVLTLIMTWLKTLYP